MTEERYVRFHEKGQGRALIELAKAYHPKNAVREIMTNCIDANIRGHVTDVYVTLNPRDKTITISDNGSGMDSELFYSLPVSIGNSRKLGVPDKRGEKALGLLSFGSLGEVMHMVTRPYGSGQSHYDYMRWEIEEKKSNISFSPEQLSSRRIQEVCEPFSHGTTVVVNRVSSHLFEKVLTIGNIKQWLQAQYNPILRRGEARIFVGKHDRRRGTKYTQISPIDYEVEGAKLVINNTGTESLLIPIKGEEEPGRLEVLLYVNPHANRDKIALHTKDVLVYESIAMLSEFEKSPVFTSGKVSGFVNDHFNKLVLGRDGIDRSRNAFKAWYQTIEVLEDKLRPIVDESRRKGKQVREHRYLMESYLALADVLKDLKKTDFIEIEEEDEDDDDDDTGKNKGGGNGGHGGEKKKRKIKIPFPCPQPIEFPQHEMHLRSKIELQLGAPILYINSIHPDYLARVDLPDPDCYKRYCVELMSKEAVNLETDKRIRSGRAIGSLQEVIEASMQREEQIRFLGLIRLGII